MSFPARVSRGDSKNRVQQSMGNHEALQIDVMMFDLNKNLNLDFLSKRGLEN
jgi:hypothetical protein